MTATDVSMGSFRSLLLAFPSADEVPFYITRNSFYITVVQLVKNTICTHKCQDCI